MLKYAIEAKERIPKTKTHKTKKIAVDEIAIFW